MATTITWTGATSNDATVASNWLGDALPMPGDTVILPGTASSSGTIDFGAALTLTDITIEAAATADALNFMGTTIDGGRIISADGSTAGAFTLSLTDSTVDDVTWLLGDFSTLDLTGSTAAGMQITSDAGQSMIRQVGTGDQLTINATGTVSSDDQLWVRSGGQATLNIAQDGTDAGFFGMKSALLDIGATLTISGDANSGTRFSNNGFVLVDGQGTLATATLDARLNNITGEFDLLGGAGGALLDDDTNMPGAQDINFGDSAGMLKIEANTTLSSAFNVGSIPTTVLQGFFGRITGFQPGDVIELVGINATGLSYSFGNNPNFGADMLTINSGTNQVALLRFPSANLADGSGTVGGADTGNFVLSSDGSGDTLITIGNTVTVDSVPVTGTVAQWGGVTNGATTDWSAANWSGGTGAGGLPGQYQAAEISLTPTEGTAVQGGSFNQYVITVTSAETVGSVTMDDPLASLLIAAPLTLAAVPGQSDGGQFLVDSGNGVTVEAGGTIATTRYYAGKGSDISIDAGGVLNVAGVASFTDGYGLAGIDVESDGQIAGGTIDDTGNIDIGQNSNGSFTAENNVVSSTMTSQVFGSVGSQVTTSYTQVGGDPVESGAQLAGANLQISGPNTSWTDAGGDASTPLSGSMLVGGGGPNVNNLDQISIASGGTGMVDVNDGATLTEQSFAILGLVKGSSGTVELDGGAQWTVGVGSTPPPGSVVVGNSAVTTGTLYGGELPRLVVGSGGTGTLNVNSSTVEVDASDAFNTMSVIVGNGNSSNDSANGVVVVQGSSALLDSAGPMVIGQRSNGFLSVGNGGTVIVSAEIPTADLEFGLSIGNQSGTVGAISGTVLVNPGGLLVDNGELTAGHGSAGVLSVSGGSVQVSAGLYLGGLLSLLQGTTVLGSPELFKGSGTGTLNLSGGGMTVASGTADMWQGSQINLSGGAALVIGSAAPAAGEISVAAGAVLQGAGLVTVTSTPSTLNNSGTVLAGGLTNGGAPDQIGATLELNAVLAGSGVFAVAPGGVLQLDNGTVNTSDFDFGTQNFGTATGTSELIRVLSPGSFQGTVGDFYGTGNGIDFVGAGFTLDQNPTPIPDNAGAVQVATGEGTFTFHVTGSHPGGFTAVSDGGGGTEVFANDATPCFAAGTRILTASGEVAVEDLRIGDRLPTLAGAVRTVRWIGRTEIDLDRHARPECVAPVRVAAHAFGPGMPHRTLRLSPDHAVALEEALIPIRLLVNGASIAREPAHGVVRYFHVELDAHAVLLAEGLPAESYLDTGNRDQFANAGGASGLRPDLAGVAGPFDLRAWPVGWLSARYPSNAGARQ